MTGFTGVGAFTGFLFLTQNPNDISNMPIAAEAELSQENASANTVPPAAPESITAPVPVPAPRTSAPPANKDTVQMKTFLHSPQEMNDVVNFPAGMKTEREKVLEQLSWDLSPGATATLPAKAGPQMQTQQQSSLAFNDSRSTGKASTNRKTRRS
ncbi:hypothetical protein ACTID9_15415 [Brevibacillus fluminis]|uniref:hypothetical protein n=1 Tax=Brevibacillus fluminis TaxID=511487 RepID=UPI003F890E65